jgi:hypothetical protein
MIGVPKREPPASTSSEQLGCFLLRPITRFFTVRPREPKAPPATAGGSDRTFDTLRPCKPDSSCCS